VAALDHPAPHRRSAKWAALAALLAGGCLGDITGAAGDDDVDATGPSPDGAAGADGGQGPGDAAVTADGAPGEGPPANRFGIGLVGPGQAEQWDRAAELAGRGGHIKLIFAGVDRGASGPEAGWVTAVAECYARDLVPVIRMGPPWGDRDLRSRSDDAGHRSYTELAAAYAAVVAGLPLREGWPLVIEVHNEPNLCYEWVCDPGDAPDHPEVPDGWMHYTDVAAEYAAFLRDVTAALRALGEPRIRVINGGLAPGGAVSCQCGGDGYTAGITSREFLVAMEDAVPGVHAALDGFASHSYPAEGEGWGFFVPYDRAGPGLRYFQTELAALGLARPVYVTETGWTVSGGASREEVAAWTASAWEGVWLDDGAIAAVMPFMLQDPS
jgi:hypothetical protein